MAPLISTTRARISPLRYKTLSTKLRSSLSSSQRLLQDTRNWSTLQRRSLHHQLTPVLSKKQLVGKISSFVSAKNPISTAATAATPEQSPTSSQSQSPSPRKEPSYEMTFTCKPCGGRSTHTITKHGYHRGTVLITCPTCSNRHIISDHLKIFGDGPFDLEKVMKERGDVFRQGNLSEDGKVELWEDGTTTTREQAPPEQ